MSNRVGVFLICAALAVALLLFFVGFFALMHSKTERNDRNIDRITACIEDGGIPEYTQNKLGQVVNYLGCVKL